MQGNRWMNELARDIKLSQHQSLKIAIQEPPQYSPGSRLALRYTRW